MLAPELRLRQVSLDEAPTLSLIGSATLLEAFAGLLPVEALLSHCHKGHSPEAWRELLSQPESKAWLAEAFPGGAPAGYALLSRPEFPEALVRPGDVELRRIYLFSRFHGTGVGQRVLHAAIDSAIESGYRRLLLGCHRDNVRGISFYLRNGFQEVGTRPFVLGPNTFLDPVFARPL